MSEAKARVVTIREAVERYQEAEEWGKDVVDYRELPWWHGLDPLEVSLLVCALVMVVLMAYGVLPS